MEEHLFVRLVWSGILLLGLVCWLLALFGAAHVLGLIG